METFPLQFEYERGSLKITLWKDVYLEAFKIFNLFLSLQKGVCKYVSRYLPVKGTNISGFLYRAVDILEKGIFQMLKMHS